MTRYKPLYEQEKAENTRLRELIESSDDDKARELERLNGIVDLAGIARHMRVDRRTPKQWRQRGLLPPVDFPEITEPLWYVSTLKRDFVDRTGRLWYDDPEEPEREPARPVSIAA